MATVILDVTATPQTFTTGNWPLTTLNTGTWRITVTPTNASTHAHHNDYRAILAASDNGGLWFATPTDAIGLYDASSGSPIFERTVTWAAGATITILVDMAAGSATVSGCSTGNGTFSFTPANGFSAGTLGAGRYPPNSGFDLAATVGDVDDGNDGPTVFTRSAIVAATAAITSAATFQGTRERSAAIAATAAVTSVGAIQGVHVRSAAVAATGAVTAQGLIPGSIGIGGYGFMFQLYGAGSTPAPISLDDTNGSTLLLSRGGRLDDGANTPTDEFTNTWVNRSETEYPDWPDYGVTNWIARNITGSVDHDLSMFVTSGDEISAGVIEIIGTTNITGTIVNRANSGATATQNAVSITVPGPAVLVLDWWGAGPPQNGHHTASASGSDGPFTKLGGYGTDTPVGYVQWFRFYKVVNFAGTYNAAVLATPTQGSQIHLHAFYNTQRWSLVDATAGITTSAIRIHIRSAAVSATAGIASSGVGFVLHERSASVGALGSAAVSNYLQVLLRSSSATGVGTVASAATFYSIFTRASLIDAVGGVTAAPQRLVLRAGVVTASASIATAPQRYLSRASAIDATAQVLALGQQRTLLRTASANAGTAISSSGHRLLTRTSAHDAVASVASDGFAILERSAAISCAGSVTAVAEQSGVYESAASAGATGAISVAAFVRDRLRQSAVGAVAGIATSATFYSTLTASSVISAVAGLTSVPQRELQRSSLTACAAAIEVVGETSTAGVVLGAASVAASCSLSTAHMRILMRQAGVAHTGGIESSKLRIAIRQVLVNGTASFTISGVRDLHRSSVVAALGALGVGGFGRELQRSSTATAVAGIVASGAPLGIEVFVASASMGASAGPLAGTWELDRNRTVAVQALGGVTAHPQREIERSCSINGAANCDLGRPARIALGHLNERRMGRGRRIMRLSDPSVG